VNGGGSTLNAASNNQLGWETFKVVKQTGSGAIHNGDIVFALFPTPNGHAPERRFETLEHVPGAESIVLEGASTAKFELSDMDRLER